MNKNNKVHYFQLYEVGQSVSRSYEVRNKVAILTRLPILNNFSNKKILEIGFGTGDLLRAISLNNEDNFFVGVEFIHSAVYNLKKDNPDFHLCRGNAEKLPFYDGSFDIVICSHVIEHIKDDKAAIAEIARVLKGNGSAIIAVPVYGDSPLHYRQYTANKLKSLANKCGLTPVYLRPHGSILAKTIHKIINTLSSGAFRNQSVIKDNPRYLLSLKKLYYGYFVPFWLFLDRVDDFFARFDQNPTQIVGVFRKNDI